MSSLASNKRQALRKAFQQQRLALSAEQQTQAATQLVKQYQNQTQFSEAKHIALYLSFNGEINTTPLIEFLWSKGCCVYVPILHPFCKGNLLFQALTASTPLHKNQFGINEPTLNAQRVCPVQQLDIMFTPLVAFDKQGNRLGMGGGFYDRTLAKLNQQNSKQKPTVVGLAHELQLTSQLPVEAWDIPLPYILTSNKLYSFS